jgi:farnesyl diphosphate synthase
MPTIVQNGAAQQQLAGTTTLEYANIPSVKATDLKTTAKKRRFQDVFPLLKEELVQTFKESKMPKDATEWFARVSEVQVLPD